MCLTRTINLANTQFRYQLVFFIHIYGYIWLHVWLVEGCLWHLLPRQNLPSASFDWRHVSTFTTCILERSKEKSWLLLCLHKAFRRWSCVSVINKIVNIVFLSSTYLKAQYANSIGGMPHFTMSIYNIHSYNIEIYVNNNRENSGYTFVEVSTVWLKKHSALVVVVYAS